MSTELSPIDADASDVPNLTQAQSLAVVALVGGATITAAAAAAGVSRPTLYAWIDTVPWFTVELNRVKAEHHEAIRGELRGLATAAVATLRDLLESRITPKAIRLRTALAVLEAVRDEPIGPTALVDVALAQQARDGDRMLSSLTAGI